MISFFKNDKIYRVIVVILSLLAVVSLIQGCRNAARDSQDFQWDATKVFSMKINPYDESVNPSGILDSYDFEKYYLQMEANQFPSLLCLLLPFTVLSPLTARYTWLIFNILLTAVMIYLLRKTFLKDIELREFIILSLLMLAGTPYRNQIGVGQHTIFAFTFFLLSVFISEFCEYFIEGEKRNDRNNICLRVVLVSLCLFICYFKYTLTVPLVLYFIYKRRYVEIAISVVLHIVLTVFSAFWLNDSVINMIIKPLKVSSKLATEGGLDIQALLRGSNIAYVFLLVIMIGLLVISFKLEPGHDHMLISALVLWSLIVTYHRTYDFFIIITVVSGIYELCSSEVIFMPVGKESVKANKKALMEIYHYFYITMIAVFFVLRIFSENTFSKVIVGTMYYTLTFMMTALLIYVGFCNKEKTKKEGIA